MKTCCICGEPLFVKYTTVGKNYVCIDCAGVHTVDEIMAETESIYNEPDVIEVAYQVEFTALPENKNFSDDESTRGKKITLKNNKKIIIRTVKKLPKKANEGDIRAVQGHDIPFIYIEGKWRECVPEDDEGVRVC